MRNYLDPHNMDPSRIGKPYRAMPEPTRVPPAPPSTFQPPFNWCGEQAIGAPFDEPMDMEWIDNTLRGIVNDNISRPYIAPCGCGGKAHLTYKKWIDQKPEDILWDVVCPKCGIIIEDFETAEDARKAWNRAMNGKCKQ